MHRVSKRNRPAAKPTSIRGVLLRCVEDIKEYTADGTYGQKQKIHNASLALARKYGYDQPLMEGALAWNWYYCGKTDNLANWYVVMNEEQATALLVDYVMRWNTWLRR